jgi:hypothetical protein
MKGYKYILKFLVLISFVLISMNSNANQNEEKVSEISKRLLLRYERHHLQLIVELAIKQMIEEGSPIEKTAALDAAKEGLIIGLIPTIIEAISDKTTAPKLGDTGWSYIGRQAAWMIGHMVIKLDKEWIVKKDEDIHGFLMKINNDPSREKVKEFWNGWWEEYKRKNNIKQFPKFRDL